MRLPTVSILLIAVLIQDFLFADDLTVPKREVRAVWVTTAASLDWPRSLNQIEQQTSLREIVSTLKTARFNTIYFQVRARGDAYYRSVHEPWAENLTGIQGKDPGWDPLAFLLKEARENGLELHAWFNVFKVRGPNSNSTGSIQHPSRTFAQWLVQYEGEFWLDPGVPEVRKYLVNIALDLVKNYAVDGIHFDFIRYPGANFPDAETYRLYGNGMNREDWRRENINKFVSEFYNAATIINPMLKVGSAPLGNFEGVKNGDSQGSFFRVYQDSRGWLSRKVHDYLVPQIYWSLGSTPGNPDFAYLARWWKLNSFGRHIIAGVGAYKPDVQAEISAEIDTVRGIGLEGASFFRYENIKNLGQFSGRYRTLANIPPMPWKDNVPPGVPANLAVVEVEENIFHLEWKPPPAAPDGDRARYYNVYRSSKQDFSISDASHLIAITASDANHFVDTIRTPQGYKYYYAVSAFDKGNNESAPSNVASVMPREVAILRGKISPLTSLAASLSPRGSDGLVAFELGDRVHITLDLLEKLHDQSEQHLSTLANGVKDPGTYVVGLGNMRLKPSTYVIRLTAGDRVLEEAVEFR